MPPSQPGVTGTTWRRRQPLDTPGESKTLRLVLWSILLIVVVASLFWLLRLWRASHVTHIGLWVTQHDVGVVPLLPYQHADEQALRELIGQRAESGNFTPFLSDTTQNLPEVAEALGRADAHEQHAAILYVSTHGIVRDGRPCLLASNFRREAETDAAAGLYPMEQLLTRLSASRAGLKLLLLDAGRIVYDPPLGVLLNDFPSALEETVAGIADDQLWVLVSHATGQLSGADVSRGRSLFGQSVTAALAGAADQLGDRNGRIDLHEFCHYVSRDISRWTLAGERPLQTPLLLQGGKGRVDLTQARSCTITLATVPRSVSATEPAAEVAPTEPPTAPSSPTASAASTAWPPGRLATSLALLAPRPTADNVSQPASTSAEDPPPSTTDAPAPGAADADGTPGKSLAGDAAAGTSPAVPAEVTPSALIHQLWQARDALAGDSAGRSPIDFAPVAWRRLETWLVGMEAQVHRGVVTPSLRRLLLNSVAALETLAQELRSDGASPAQFQYGTQYVADIARAWRAFQADSSRQQLLRSDMEPLARAWQLANRVRYELPYFMRWQAITVFNEGQASCPDGLRAEVIQALEELLQTLNSLGPTLEPSMQQTLEARQRRLLASYQSLHGHVRQACTQVGSRESGPVTERRLYALLATPLLAADERAAILSMPPGPSTPELTADAMLRADSNMASPPAAPSEAMRSIVAWELAFLQLCDPDRPEWTVPRELDARTLRDWEVTLREYFQTLPMTRDPSRQQSLAWLLDPHERRATSTDPTAGPWHAWRPAIPSTGPPLPPTRLEWLDVPAAIRLAPSGSAPARCLFVGQGLQGNQATAHLQFDATRLRVRDDQGRALAPDTPVPVPLDDSPEHQLLLHAEYIGPGDMATPPLRLRIRLSAIDVQDQPRDTDWREVACAVPAPFDVELWTARHDETFQAPVYRQGSRIHPYPNRTTPIRLALANRSQVAQTVKVQLYAVPAPDPRGTTPLLFNWAPGRIFAETRLREPVSRIVFTDPGTHTVRSNVTLLAEALVDLPEDTTARRPIEWVPPGALVPAATEAPATGETGPPPTTPPPPPAEFTAQDISHGLLLLITSGQDPEQRITKWLEVAPVHPADFLAVENVRFARGVVDARARSVVQAQLRLRPDRSLPNLAEQPVHVRWQDADVRQLASAVTEARLLGGPTSSLQLLWGEVLPSFSEYSMQLAVDDYPRAFAYLIPCNETDAGRSLEDRQFAVRIVGITPRYRQVRADDDAAGGPVEVAVDATGDRVVRVPLRSESTNPCVELRVRAEVDAPRTAFENSGTTLRIADTPRFADRQVHTTLDRLSPDGAILVTSRVSDHAIPLNVEGRAGDVVIRAELQRENQEPVVSQIVAVLDGRAPQVTGVRGLPARITVNTPLTLDVDFTDHGQAGGEQLMVAVDVNASGTIDDGDVQTTVSLQEDDTSARVVLPTGELKTGGEGFRILVQVRDRVGLLSETWQSSSLLRIDPMKEAPQAAPATGTIAGTLYINQREVRLSRGTVTIKELGRVANVDGARFRFDDVPMGTYTLEANASSSGYPYVSDPDVPVTATPKPPKDATPRDHAIHLVRPK